jgi:membrane-associated protein
MELMKYALDVILHLDRHLGLIIADYGFWTHLFLFLIIFCETGLVVAPFLPATPSSLPRGPSRPSALSTS